MRKIISDSSSLILLYKCGAAGFFLNNCICVIPEPVRSEITADRREGSDFFKQCILKGGLSVKNNKTGSEPFKKLHKGESGVISLYEEGCGEYVLIDDRKGAAFCRDSGIPYINALLVIKILLLNGIINQEKYKAMFSWLKINGRYSKAVIEWAETAGSDKLEKFLF